MHDLSRGSIRGHLLRMSSFMLVTMLVQTLYGLIDLFWVGRLSGAAVAAVSIGGNLMMVTGAVAQVLAVGASALVAQAMGRKDVGSIGPLFNQSMLVSAIAGLLLGLLMFWGRHVYARALSGDAPTAALTSEFLLWFVPALGLQVPMMVLSSTLRGVGNVRISSIAQVATIVLNIVLAPFLIFGWGTGLPMGVAGAALATLVSIVLGLVGMLLYMARGETYFAKSAGSWRLQPRDWYRISVIGLPSGLEFGLMAVYIGAVMALLQPFGSATQAGFGIGMRILQAGMMPAMAISFAAGAVVGQNHGAGRSDRVRETFWLSLKLALVISGAFVLLLHLAPGALIGLFSDDPAVVVGGADFLRLISWNLLATTVVFACFGVFSGLGDTRPSLISSAVRFACILIPAFVLSRYAGFAPEWVWWLSVTASVIQAAMNAGFLRYRFRALPAPKPVATAA